MLSEFCSRGILHEENNVFSITVPFFKSWLVHTGFNNLLTDRFGEELISKVNAAEEKAVDMVKRAGKDGFQGIKLYPSSWDFHAYDERVYPIYE